MAKITYDDKVAVNTNSGIPNANKVTDTNMNDIKGAINQLGNYNAVTAGSNGDFYGTFKGTLATNDMFLISVPNATNTTSNARLSLTGSGGTYINLKNIGGYQLLGSDVQNKKLECCYNGTDLIVLNINDIGKYIKIGKSSSQPINAATTTKITFNTVVNNNSKGLSFDDTNDRITIGKGINMLLIRGQYQENTLTTGILKYIYIWKNGVQFQAYQINNQNIVDITSIIPVTENDYIEMYCYGSLALTIQSSTDWTFLQALVVA